MYNCITLHHCTFNFLGVDFENLLSEFNIIAGGIVECLLFPGNESKVASLPALSLGFVY
jgi:hypothetical protein